jgi:AcrR family transcriptional regulator
MHMALSIRSTYRHGNLQQAAVEAAYLLIIEGGAAGFTLRRIAEQLGVSHRALYRYFTDSEALFASVAALGFERLAQALENATSRAAYVENYSSFALSYSGVYHLMMSRSRSTIRETPALASAVHRVTSHAMIIFAKKRQDAVITKRSVMKIWMALHGAITLHEAGILHARSTTELIAEIKHILAVDLRSDSK